MAAGIACGAILWSPDDAQAQSADCAVLNGGDLNFPNIGAGPFATLRNYQLQQGEVITVTWANMTSFRLLLNGAVIVEVPPQPANGTHTFTVPNDGFHVIAKENVSAGGNGDIAFTCQAAPAPTSPAAPSTDAVRASNIGQSLHGMMVGGRPSSAPSALPSTDAYIRFTRPFTDEERRQLEAEIEKLERERESASSEVFTLGVLGAFSIDPESHAVTPVAYRLREALFKLEQIEERLDVKKWELSRGVVFGEFLPIQLLPANGQVGAEGTDFDPVEIGDADHVLYAPHRPAAGSHVPWPAEASGYDERRDRITSINHATEHAFTTDRGRRGNLWMRMHGTLHDGSFGRTGVSGSLQAGAVVGVSRYVDLGFLAHILMGRVESTTLDARLDSLAGAIGVYAKFSTPTRLRFGLSALHEWGGNDIRIGTATGSFGSTFWTVNAEASLPFSVNGLNITPSLLASWRSTTLAPYVDSNGMAVPGSANQQLVVSGALDLNRPIPLSGERLRVLTPQLTIRANYLAMGAQMLDFGPGFGSLASSVFTVDVGAGLGFQFTSGSQLNANVTASGLAGNERAYGLQLRFRKPLN